MKVLLDACVLYPTVMREMLLGAAGAGLYEPLWSARILEEWARAAERLGAGDGAVARGEIALLKMRWPRALIQLRAGDMARLWLPDENDIHVLAAAIAGSADLIVTENRADFPGNILAEEGLARQGTDLFLLSLYRQAPEAVQQVGARVCAEAERLSGRPWPIRALMKKARLPRLGKVLEAGGGAR